jgi:ATP-dependent RNA helicase DHX8/PRP22
MDNSQMNVDKFCGYFVNCPIFTILKQTFPVEIPYTKQLETNYLDVAFIKMMWIHLIELEADITFSYQGKR